MLKNPKINRVIGYAALFIGFFLFYKGFHTYTAADGINGRNIPLIVISVILVIASVVWQIKKVRCPHCGALLQLKLYNIDVCPYCGKRTDETDRDA